MRPAVCSMPVGQAELDVGDRAPDTDPLLSRVLGGLGADPVHPDDLAAALGVEMATLAAALTALQLRGAITDVCGGRVARTF
jgi:predicted Rossmann fold nucleotide-binding protein DprA/Smf involved in DNA uptake